VTDESRSTEADRRQTGQRTAAADSPADEAPASSGERVVIRDKRKAKVSTKASDVDTSADAGPDAEAEPGTDAEIADEAADAATGGADGTGDDAKVETPVPAALGAELESLRSALDERTQDLQRVSAEYANYRKRVDRDRALVVEQATGNVLAALLPVLDDLDRARDHGDLIGPFGAVAEQLNTALTKFGLTAFGGKGDPFDPTRHEAVAHLTSSEVTEPTCITVMRRGYLLGERLLRPALVAVADPEPDDAGRAAGAGAEPTESED
jgi:molecular chaperone GrpE